MLASSGRQKAGKVAKAKAELLRQIKMNNFPRGGVLPPERDLPALLGASYMTVRKAVGELVEEGCLERRPGVGTYVCMDIPKTRMSKVLGIVCPAWNSPEVSDFAIHMSDLAVQRGWCPKLFFCRFWEDRALEDAWNACDALAVIPLGSVASIPKRLAESFSSRRKPFVLVGVGASLLGMDSVAGAEGHGVRMALDRLALAGHRRIALVGSFVVKDEFARPDDANASAWRQWIERKLGPGSSEGLLFDGVVPEFEMPHHTVYRMLSEALPKRGFTALVAPFCVLHAATAAISDAGLRVPSDISVAALGDRQESAFYRPRVSYVKSSLRRHAERVMDVVSRRLASPEGPAERVSVEPELVEGDTIGECPKRGVR